MGCIDHIHTVAELLQYRASENPDGAAYVFLDFPSNDTFNEHPMTYRKLDARSRSMAGRLRESIEPGERALLLYPPGLDYITAFFACQYAGVIAVPSYPPFTRRALAQFLSIVLDAGPKRILSTKTIADSVCTLAASIERQQICPEGMWLFTDEDQGICSREAVTPNRISFLQYTSGSTSRPKGVMLTQENLLHNLSLIRECFGHGEGSRGVIWLPPYHDMGLIGGILQPLYAGFPVYLFSPLSFLKRPLRWLQAITRYRATTSGGPNFAYELCIRKVTPEQRRDLDLSSWDLAFNGAEPIQPPTIERFAEAFRECGFRFRAFYPCYGLAESTLIVSGGRRESLPVIRPFDRDALSSNQVREPVRPENPVKGCVGCGGSLERGEIAIVAPDTMTRCAPGRIGEVWVRGPSVAAGYWNNPEETEAVFHAYLRDTKEGPYLRTGDLGFLHLGELFITGRIKDVIIHRGMNIYPSDIEQTAERCHPYLRKGCNAVFSVHESDKSRIVLLQEVSFEPEEIVKKQAYEIVNTIRSAVAIHHGIQVSEIALVRNNSLLKTSSGKIQRHACRNAYLSGSLDPIFTTLPHPHQSHPH